MNITLENIEASPRIAGDHVGLVDEMAQRLLPAVVRGGLFMEFGVWQGNSIRRLIGAMRKCGIISSPIYGFDSFKGLPEAWGTLGEGSFNIGGYSPDFQDKGIVIVPGWFNEVLPDFLLNHPGFASFIHIDCDVYSSAKYVLTALKDRIIPGTIILFDEMINVMDYEQHEFKAFNEFLNEQNRLAQTLCHGKYQVAFRITK